jgi:hypothetical protein
MVERDGSVWSLLMRAIMPLRRAPPPDLITSQRPIPVVITLGRGASRHEFENKNLQSITLAVA